MMRTRRSLRDSDSQANSPIDSEDEDDDDRETRSAASDVENTATATSPTIKKTPSVSRGRTGKTASQKDKKGEKVDVDTDPMDFVR